MDKKASSLNSSNIIANDDSNIRSKLRRLRIQEALLLQSIQKSNRNTNDVDVETRETVISSSNSQDSMKKVKDYLIHLKNVYDEVKANTQNQELLADLDIEEMKKKIFELETNIKKFKLDIASELAALRITELDLIKQLNGSPNKVECIKQQHKTHLVNFNAIVPSPVKVLMTCPLKCLDVQQFQEFMQNSLNRYGGWNEYSHNIFVKYWQKFLGKGYSSEFEDDTIEQSVTYKKFMEEVTPKLQGVTTSEIVSHVKWYVKYLFLKEKQQTAINKWKFNKISVRKVTKKVQYVDDCLPRQISLDDDNFIYTNRYDQLAKGNMSNKTFKSKTVIGKIDNQERTLSLMKPTKQWLNRSHNDNAPQSSKFHHIENTGKLRTPQWRLGL